MSNEDQLEKMREYIMQQEVKFIRVLLQKGMKIKEMEGDGNCLFRAISDQVYNGDDSHYDLIRQSCMDYI